MNSMNISLPPAMAEFVRRRVEREYGNVSEFFRELVRERIRREIEVDLAFLATTGQGAEPGPTEREVEDVLLLQKQVRRRRRARRL